MLEVTNTIYPNVEVNLTCEKLSWAFIYASVIKQDNLKNAVPDFGKASFLSDFGCGKTFLIPLNGAARIYIASWEPDYLAAVVLQPKIENGGGSSGNLGLIIRIAVGAVGLITAIFVGVYCSKKRQNDFNEKLNDQGINSHN